MKKAPNGQGTTNQRKDGTWQGQITLPAQGLTKAIRRSVYGKTQAEVLAKLRHLQTETSLGVRPGKAPTVAEYGREFLEVTFRAQVDLGQNAESTLRNYRNIWKRHIEPDLGHWRLKQVTPKILRQWQVSKARTLSAHRHELLAASTQVRIHAVLHAVLVSAYRDELIPYNPLDKVKRPRNATSEVIPLTESEMTALLKTLKGSRFLRTLVLLMAMTGARPGEALAASWADIDLGARRWHISRSLARLPIPGRAGSTMTLGVSRTKTEASNATITLPEIVVAALRQHRVRQSAERLAQLALAWLLRRSPVMLPIPGTGSVAHLEENCAAAEVTLTDEDFDRLSTAV